MLKAIGGRAVGPLSYYFSGCNTGKKITEI